jgi:alkanesulfonate monooxygenase SsuD/methylene tetrahydromethanopterin reductase-like flavin-dependent oxidoreductase (luciferase family)
MIKHGIKGAIGGGAATMREGPISAYRDAAARAGIDLKLGENLMLGFFVHLADTREKAIRELRPMYEEHAKMFAPLGFVPGVNEAQIAAIGRRGGWYEAGVPTLEHFMKLGSWFAGTPEDLVAYLKELEERYPGMEHINLSTPMSAPESVMLEQLGWIAEAVMPKFRKS